MNDEMNENKKVPSSQLEEVFSQNEENIGNVDTESEKAENEVKNQQENIDINDNDVSIEARTISDKPNLSKDVILSVRHLKQYFKYGHGMYKYNKAVHDVSFDLHRGEVLGLVGESGCGKTTTGRSIIKLYNITSGSIWFEGRRIGAGTRWNEKEIKFKSKKAHKEISDLEALKKKEIADVKALKVSKEETKEKISKIKEKYNPQIEKIIQSQYKEISSAKKDNNNCNKYYAREQIRKVKAEYKPKFKKVNSDFALKVRAYKNIKKDFTPKGPNKSENFREIFKQELKNVNAGTTELKSINIFGLFGEYLLNLWKVFFNFCLALHYARHDKITNKMQMIFQDPIASLDPRMTVREIIAEGLRIRGVHSNKIIDQKVNDVLTEVGLLPEHATRYPHEFSGGQRQRIGIARALIMDPDLIIADEPISALDVSIQAQVINLLNDLRKKRNLSILFIAHDLSVVKYFCDRIAVMYLGNLVEEGSSDEIFKNPLHPYTRSLLSAIPLPDPHYEKNRKRFDYNPLRDHDYSKEEPTLKEIKPGHFVLANSEEIKKYKQMLK